MGVPPPSAKAVIFIPPASVAARRKYSGLHPFDVDAGSPVYVAAIRRKFYWKVSSSTTFPILPLT